MSIKNVGTVLNSFKRRIGSPGKLTTTAAHDPCLKGHSHGACKRYVACVIQCI